LDLGYDGGLKHFPNQMEVEINDNEEIRKKFYLYFIVIFSYPDINESTSVIDYEYLEDTDFLVMCVQKGNTYKIYLWKGKSVELEEDVIKLILNCTKEINVYISEVRNHFFTKHTHDLVEYINEEPLGESDEFFSLL